MCSWDHRETTGEGRRQETENKVHLRSAVAGDEVALQQAHTPEGLRRASLLSLLKPSLSCDGGEETQAGYLLHPGTGWQKLQNKAGLPPRWQQ